MEVAISHVPSPLEEAVARAAKRFTEWLDTLWQPPQPEPKRRKRVTAKPRQKVPKPLMLPAPTHPEHRTIH
jgi:hypothetical protein